MRRVWRWEGVCFDFSALILWRRPLSGFHRVRSLFFDAPPLAGTRPVGFVLIRQECFFLREPCRRIVPICLGFLRSGSSLAFDAPLLAGMRLKQLGGSGRLASRRTTRSALMQTNETTAATPTPMNSLAKNRHHSGAAVLSLSNGGTTGAYSSLTNGSRAVYFGDF